MLWHFPLPAWQRRQHKERKREGYKRKGGVKCWTKRNWKKPLCHMRWLEGESTIRLRSHSSAVKQQPNTTRRERRVRKDRWWVRAEKNSFDSSLRHTLTAESFGYEDIVPDWSVGSPLTGISHCKSFFGNSRTCQFFNPKNLDPVLVASSAHSAQQAQKNNATTHNCYNLIKTMCKVKSLEIHNQSILLKMFLRNTNKMYKRTLSSWASLVSWTIY